MNTGELCRATAPTPSPFGPLAEDRRQSPETDFWLAVWRGRRRRAGGRWRRRRHRPRRLVRPVIAARSHRDLVALGVHALLIADVVTALHCVRALRSGAGAGERAAGGAQACTCGRRISAA